MCSGSVCGSGCGGGLEDELHELPIRAQGRAIQLNVQFLRGALDFLTGNTHLVVREVDIIPVKPDDRRVVDVVPHNGDRLTIHEMEVQGLEVPGDLVYVDHGLFSPLFVIGHSICIIKGLGIQGLL